MLLRCGDTARIHPGLAMNAVAVRPALRIAAPGPVLLPMLARGGDAPPQKSKNHVSRQWPRDAAAFLLLKRLGDTGQEVPRPTNQSLVAPVLPNSLRYPWSYQTDLKSLGSQPVSGLNRMLSRGPSILVQNFWPGFKAKATIVILASFQPMLHFPLVGSFY